MRFLFFSEFIKNFTNRFVVEYFFEMCDILLLIFLSRLKIFCHSLNKIFAEKILFWLKRRIKFLWFHFNWFRLCLRSRLWLLYFLFLIIYDLINFFCDFFWLYFFLCYKLWFTCIQKKYLSVSVSNFKT